MLFVALAMGWFAPDAAPAPMLGTFGLALFLYAVGIQYGKQFFAGLTSVSGLRANFLALVGILFSGLVSLVIMKVMGLSLEHALGLFAGSEHQHAGTAGRTRDARATTIPPSATRSRTRSAWPVRSCVCISPSRFSSRRSTCRRARGMELLEIALTQPGVLRQARSAR